jgi:hypothetical protein
MYSLQNCSRERDITIVASSVYLVIDRLTNWTMPAVGERGSVAADAEPPIRGGAEGEKKVNTGALMPCL